MLRSYELGEDGAYHALGKHWFPAIGLGVRLWQGNYENWDNEWLRWYDRRGRLVPISAELSGAAQRRIEKLEAQLRARGIEPSP